MQMFKNVPTTRSRRHWHSLRLSSSLPWPPNGNSGKQVYVYCQGCGPETPDLWPVSLFHRGKQWAHSGNVFAVKKQRRNELFKLECGLILEIGPQITLNAPLHIKKTTYVTKTICHLMCVLWNNTQTAFKLLIWDVISDYIRSERK